MVHLVIDGLSSLYIRADHGKLQWVLLEGLDVELVIFERYHMVAEVGIVVVATLQQRLPATVAWVLGETGVVANGSTNLVRLVVTAKGRSC